MSDQRDIDSLNRLLRAESGSLIHRLAEASPHVSWPAAGDHLIVQEMRSEIFDHQRSLAMMILDLRGAPSPPGYPIETGSTHYLELSFLMPQVIANARRRISMYETAGVQSHSAATLVNRILGDHRRHLGQLERIHSNLAQRV